VVKGDAKMLYLICYDLCDKDKDYKDLYDRLDEFKDQVRITDSSRIIWSIKSAALIRDYISMVMESDDKLFVGTLKHEAAGENLIGNSEKLKALFERLAE
jgi:hypothetical protein